MHPHKINRYLLLFAMIVFASNSVQAQEVKLVLPVGHTYHIRSAIFSPDGKKIATASWDKTAKIWDASSGQLLHSLEGHTGFINAANFSPDRKKIVTASDDNTAKIWDAVSGQLVFSLEGHTKEVKNASFSPDSKKIITASYDRTAKIWDASSGRLVRSLEGHRSSINSATFSPDGKKIVTTSSYETAIWDAVSGELLHSLEGNILPVIGASFSPDSKKIVTSSADNTAKIWDAVGGQLIHNLNRHTDDVESAIFSPDGKKIVTTSKDKTAKVWDASSGQLIHNLVGHTSTVNNATFSPDGKKIATASSDNTAKTWDAFSGILVNSLERHTSTVNNATFNPNGKKIVTASWDGTAKIWDAASGLLEHNLLGHTKDVESANLSPDGKKIVTASGDKTAKIWDAGNGQLLHSLQGHTNDVESASFSPDGEKIVTASRDKTAKIWDAVSGKLLHNLQGHKDVIKSASFSPDGKKILTASNKNIAKIWDAASGQLLQSIEGHAQLKPYIFLFSATFSPDGKKIVTTSDDKNAKIWDIASGQLLHSLEKHAGYVNSATFSPDGKKIITLTFDKTAKVWDAISGQLAHNLQGHEDNVINSTFSPDSKKIVTVSGDKTAKIWDATSGQLVRSLAGHANRVYSAKFSPDGKTIITASADGTVKLWDAATGSLQQTMTLGANTLLFDINFTANTFTAIKNSEVKLFSLTTGKQLLSYFAIDSTDWAVLHPSGLFDASSGAMDKMYWVKGDEVIEFGQLKDRYWQPGLWKMIMDGQPLRSVAGMNTLQLQPEIELGELKNNILTIQLKKRDGGYGKVAILVNNKEVITDARPKGFDTTKVQQTIVVNLAPYLVAGLDNTISVKAQSANGFVSSRGVPLIQKATTQTAAKKPAFYAIICGTGEFSNPAIKLKYAVPDAAAIAKAVTIGANNLFGKDSTHVYLLASPGNTPTTKQNIQQAFANIKTKAKAEDIVMVYLSGHGISYGGDNGDFYYLTTEASGTSAESFADPALRQAQAINTAEFTQWLNAIPALKQVMIIDACGSGKAVDNLIAKRDINASQIKAIDRMKDRTGLYIISGCAADAVSYEASRYGQGLLTYAVLQAMKGAALKENTNVDILTLLNYARDEVPKMATGIGGIQQPQLLVPKGGSFDIGIIKEADKVQIPLAQVKPVFVRATLFEETKKRDVLKLSQAINEKLNEVSARGDAKSSIVFIDTDDYPDACNISGGYTVIDNLISFNGTLLCGTKETAIKIEKVSKEQLLVELLQKAIKN